MRNQKKLILEQLDRKLKAFQPIKKTLVPEKGWIYSIRKALNMNLGQLGKKLNISTQGAKKIEEREANESISIKSLREAGNALDMQLVYGFVPKSGTLVNLVNTKAEELARKIVLRTSNNMKLENQENSSVQIQNAIIELTSDIKREMRKSLWD
ncbi:hypothetical protein BH09BAC5_BH09BAC5_04470 [soil metagenome]